MKCINCGADIPNSATFCTKCGARQEFNQELINRAAQGETQAETELYNATYNTVYALVKSMVKDEDTVLDILQDSYVKAFRNLNQLQEANKFRPWLKTIARNRTMDHFRERKTVLFSEMAPLDDENADVDFEDNNPEALPEVVIDRQETSRLISEILDALPEDQRGVISMFYYEQMSVKEIAEQLGVSDNTVKSRLNYGRKKVEEKVLDLEKKGTKLYGLAPVPFLLMLLGRQEALAMHMDDAQASLQRILQRTGGGAAEAGSHAGQQASSQIQQTGIQPVSQQPQPAGMLNTPASGVQPVQAAAVKGGVPLAAKIVAAVAAVAVVGVGAAVVIPAVTDRVSGGADVASNEITQDTNDVVGTGNSEEEDSILTGQSNTDEASSADQTDEADWADSGETAEEELAPVSLSEAQVEEVTLFVDRIKGISDGSYMTPEEIRKQLEEDSYAVSWLIFSDAGGFDINWGDIGSLRSDGGYWFVDNVDTSHVDRMFKEWLDMEFDYRDLPAPGERVFGACYYNGGVSLYGEATGGFTIRSTVYEDTKEEDGHTVIEYRILGEIGYDNPDFDYENQENNIIEEGRIRLHVSKADNSYGFRIVGLEIDWFDE